MSLRLPSVLLVAALIAVPFNVLAASSKTYTISSVAASNYTTIGTSLTTKATSNWYNPSYSHRLTLTINKEHIGEELTDFPIVVQLDSAQSHLFNTVREDGHDLVFTDKNNQKLSHEIESFDKNNKEATIWLKVPTLKPTEDTVLYLYYGNPTSEDNQNAQDVWSNGYAAVYHLNQDPAGTTEDSTKNNNDGTSSGGMNANDSLKAGKTGHTLKFDGSNDFVDMGDDESLDLVTKITISTWVNLADTTSIADFVTRDNGTQRNFSLQRWNDNIFYFNLLSSNSFRTIASSSDTYQPNTWVRIVGTYDGSISHLYLNGREDATPLEWSGTIDNDDVSLTLGARENGIDRRLNGFLDEVHLASVARSAAWISAEYTNQSGDEDFLSISTPTSTGTTSNSLITLKKDKALNYTSLHNFTPNGSTNITYQLSPNEGKTWYYYTTQGWKKTSANTPTKSSSSNDISKHLSTLPAGTGKLLWRAIFQPNSTLDSIKIDYTAGTSTNTTTIDITDKISTLFKLVYGVAPTSEQHTYWTGRLKEKSTLPALFGAMQWQKVFGS